VLRIFCILFAAFFAVQISGASSFAFEDDCAAECAAEVASPVPPPCTFCQCCFTSPVYILAGQPVTSIEGPACFLQSDADQSRALFQAREIFHVPKSHLA
jgi:hypothetical protein